MEHIFKSPDSNKVRIIFILVFSIGMLLFIGYEGHREQETILEHYGEEQLLLVQQAALFSGALQENGGGDAFGWEERMVKYLERSATSGSRYWILCRENSVLYLRNEDQTRKYQSMELSSYFLQEENTGFFEQLGKNEEFYIQVYRLEDGELMASVCRFSAEGEEYILILCTKTSYILSLNQMLAHQTYLMMAALLLCAVAIIVTLLFNGEITDAEKEILSLKNELQERNRQLTALSESKLSIFGSESSGELNKVCPTKSPADSLMEEQKLRYRQYRLKFYLNTYHYIFINGSPGELHPHTWQFMAQAVNQKEELTLFNEVEQRIEKILEKYQDQTLNEIEPFQVLNPTLENISEYFKNEFSEVLNEFGWRLVRFECSETPTRAYLIDLSEERK